MEGSSSYLRVHRTPDLRSPVLVIALSGWNDAAEVATSALRFLVRTWNAEPFAEMDPEEFFVFTEQRPVVRIDQGAQRRIDWPSNELFFRRGQGGARDCIILVGTEPHLRWRTFADTLLGSAQGWGAKLVVTMGGLLADVPHSRAVRLTGSATDPQLAERLGRLNVRSSRYEGPTGMIGVINQECRARKLSAVSIWGNVPHYINHTPNPKVAAAMLRRLDGLLELDLDLSELEEAAISFESQVADAIARDPEAQSYVRKLEERDERQGEVDVEMPALPPGELPSGEEVVRQLEEFLRRRDTEEGTGR